jgi:S1-C subfamily serine protease
MALIPPFFLDCVVAIGVDDKGDKRRWAASGFLYGHKVTTEDDKESRFFVYVVSNRHVFKGSDRVWLRFNPQASGPAREYELRLVNSSGSPLWFANPRAEIDVAVVPINYARLQQDAMLVSFFANDRHVASLEKLTELGISEGDSVYVLGFPMGMVGVERNAVIVRSGTIARIRDMLAGAAAEFVVDTFIFPGNSGGPVVSKPELMAIEGTKSQRSAYLVGVVKSYVPYRDVAVSVQTQQARVVFEENSGLAEAHSVDFVEEAIMEHIKTLGPEALQREPSSPPSAEQRPP